MYLLAPLWRLALDRMAAVPVPRQQISDGHKPPENLLFQGSNRLLTCVFQDLEPNFEDDCGYS